MPNSLNQGLNKNSQLVQVEQQSQSQDCKANHSQFKIGHLSHHLNKFWQIARTYLDIKAIFHYIISNTNVRKLTLRRSFRSADRRVFFLYRQTPRQKLTDSIYLPPHMAKYFTAKEVRNG